MASDEYPLINELLSQYFYDIYKNHKDDDSSFCLYGVEHEWLMKQIIQKLSNDNDQAKKSNSIAMTEEVSGVIDNFQMKFDPTNVTDLSNSNCEGSIQEKNYDMIVVASLITNLPNLGGICRTCEVLGIKNITLNSIKLIENREFKSLSLTSEKWLNITEIKTNDLFNYLIDKRIEGYEIIGAEQTANSKCFSNFKFPRKCVLLLGQEREGIPPELISLLNHAVEIPQFGMIRSLNVHVTGALFMWEYCKQHINQSNSIPLS